MIGASNANSHGGPGGPGSAGGVDQSAGYGGGYGNGDGDGDGDSLYVGQSSQSSEKSSGTRR